MPRPLIALHDFGAPSPADEQQDGWLSRSAARAFAAAVSALLIATLVIDRSSGALTADGAANASIVSSGTISLTDDDAGRSLFDLSDMAPARPVARCIAIVYDGTILPVDLAMEAEAGGPLDPFLDVVVEEGAGGGFDSCTEFSPRTRLFAGTLADLATGGWVELGPIVNSGTARSFRITFTLADDEAALGLTTSATFVWEATPS